MANVADLKRLVETLRTAEHTRLFRDRLLPETEQKYFEQARQQLNELVSRGHVFIEVGQYLADEHVPTAAYQKLSGFVNGVLTWGDTDYLTNRHVLNNNIEEAHRAMLKVWPFALIAQLEAAGILKEARFVTRIEALEREVRAAADQQVTRIKAETDEWLKQVTTIADEKIAAARLTARGIGLNAAQQQFKEAATAARWQVALWAFLSCAALVGFGFTARALWNIDLPAPSRSVQPSQITAWFVYHAVLRVTILSVVLGTVAFAFRMFRVHLHLLHLNAHRRRVANAMPAFIEAAQTPGQQDAALLLLMNSVTAFGDSGLVDGAPDIHLGTTALFEVAGKASQKGSSG